MIDIKLSPLPVPAFFLAVFIILPLLSGCSSDGLHKLFNKAEYWQRSDIREAAYMDPVKAQDLLHRHISQCVSTVKEQESMAALRGAMPPEKPGDGNLARWDTPERDGYLRAEHYPYHDFESCMIHKGWERAAYLPQDVANNSRAAYLDHVHPDRKKERVQNSGRRQSATGKDHEKKNKANNHSYINL